MGSLLTPLLCSVQDDPELAVRARRPLLDRLEGQGAAHFCAAGEVEGGRAERSNTRAISPN